MARAIWSGAISFGLVNVPIKMYSAVSRKTVRFHQLHDKTGQRIQQKRVDSQTGDEVPYEHIVKGYELTKDQYVVIEPEELEALDPQKTRMIQIEDFVELDQIDPIYYDQSYYLAPEKGAGKAYALLVEAMKDVGKVAIGTVVIRTKEQLVALRPVQDTLVMSTMVYDDEVLSPDQIDEIKGMEKAPVSENEERLARELIESLSSKFEPDKYHDTYREKVLDLIERKAEGKTIEAAPPAEAAQPVPDLMAALQASIAAVKPGTGEKGANGKRPSASKKPAKTAEKSKS
jgi:DNA end-binding protein Ku